MEYRFGTPISLDPYKEQFFSGEEGAPRLAVKRLTQAIEGQLVENTINAPDWYVLRMFRTLTTTDLHEGIHYLLHGWPVIYYGTRRDLLNWRTLLLFHKRKLYLNHAREGTFSTISSVSSTYSRM
jgi:hypothetical protein